MPWDPDCPTEFDQKLHRGYGGLRAYEITSKITYSLFKHFTDFPRKSVSVSIKGPGHK